MTDQSPRTALITGAARRIGRAISLDLAAHGWDIAIHYLSAHEEAIELKKEIEALGKRAILLKGDLCSAEDAHALPGRCAADLAPPTCLINNGSIFQYDDIASLTLEQWDRHIDVNLRAPILLSQAFATTLPQNESGNIINVIDQRVWKLTPQYFSYTIAKSALWTATKTLAQSLAPRIRVNAIGPGPVLQSVHQNEEQFAKQRRNTLLEKGASTEDLTRAVRFILDSPALTGQMIALDSGQHLAWQTPDIIGVE